MEWWENDYGYESVDEAVGGNRIPKVDSQKRMSRVKNVGIAAAGLAAGMGFRHWRKKKQAEAIAAAKAEGKETASAHLKGSANTKRGGYSEFEANGKVRECGTNCESWDWTDDPGAQMILESYFSEFADADIYSEAEY